MNATNTFSRQTAKFLGVAAENMPEMSGSLMQGWIENPKSLQHALRGALCPLEATAPATIPTFPTWKTIRLGMHRSSKDLLDAYLNKGFEISTPALELLMKRVTFAQVETELPLVNVSVRELGFTEGVILMQVYTRAWECGLGLVPAEAGLQLRLHYPDQPTTVRLHVGMQPLPDQEGYLSVFYLERITDLLWVTTDYGHSSCFAGPDWRWVFAQRPGN